MRLTAWAIVTALLVPGVHADIKPDEEVVFFPTYAYLDKDRQNWVIPTHGWIYEPENNSFRRSALLALLANRLRLAPDEATSDIFKKRARLFLVDNERGKRLTIHFGTSAFTLNDSLSNGHFRTSVYVPAGEVRALAARQKVKDDWLRFRVVTRRGDKRVFLGAVQFLAATGVSVISDIDDTIKVTGVGDRKTLLRNTFLREFEAVPGMAELYQGWARAGARFHYVSASPWQLYEPLRDFVAKAGFPMGSFRLKTFRWKDRSFFSLFASPEKSKPRVIERILGRFPERRFILVGDSGEVDPEIYGQIARRHPEQIVHVFIRNVTDEVADAERFELAFEGVPKERWRLFRDAAEIRERALRLVK